MGYEAIGTTIRTRFDTEFPLLQASVPYTFDNQGELNAFTKDEAWVRVTILNGTAQQVEMGNKKRWRRPGVLEIQIFLPTGDGTGLKDRIGDTIRDIFEGRTIDGVVFRATSLERSGIDGPWIQFNCSTPFQADELR